MKEEYGKKLRRSCRKTDTDGHWMTHKVKTFQKKIII
jgi:hypothetical protein